MRSGGPKSRFWAGPNKPGGIFFHAVSKIKQMGVGMEIGLAHDNLRPFETKYNVFFLISFIASLVSLSLSLSPSLNRNPLLKKTLTLCLTALHHPSPSHIL